MSPELKSFYLAYNAWLEEGAPEGQPFSRETGLCSNLEQFDVSLLAELQTQFSAGNFVREIFPFNPVAGSYDAEYKAGLCHLNPERIAWVKEMVK